MVRRNMQKIHYALTHMSTVLNGLTRGLPLEVIDRGFGEQSGARVSLYPTTNALGLVMPSNSPAVNSLWLPAIALKTPVIIKPGREEPWTPYRLIQAFIAAGAPAEAFGFYPTDHEGSGEVMKLCGRALIFGDANTVEQYRGQPEIQRARPRLEQDAHRRRRDRKLAELHRSHRRLHRGKRRPFLHQCQRRGGAEVRRRNRRRACAKARPHRADAAGGRKRAPLRLRQSQDGRLHRQRHRRRPANARRRRRHREVPQRPAQGRRGTASTCARRSCAATPSRTRSRTRNSSARTPAWSKCRSRRCSAKSAHRSSSPPSRRIRPSPQQLLESPLIERLNLGPVPTMKISWDQPHEGNMFEFLYRRRSIELGW